MASEKPMQEGEFSMVPTMRRRFQAATRPLAFGAGSEAEWRAWRATLGAKLRSLTGYDRLARGSGLAEVTERVDCGSYVRERLVLETEPGVAMPLYVLLPKKRTKRSPAVIATHGHGSAGKAATAGRRDLPGMAEVIDTYNYDYGVQLAAAGFIVFCPDARGFGERQEAGARAASPTAASCNLLNHMGIPLGLTVTGMWTWDLHRLIDYIATRPEVDAERIGIAGLSGGGLQSLWAAALDERLKAVVVSGYFYGFEESLLVLHGNCSCNYVPGLWEQIDIGDLGALIAPRGLLIETGDADPLNGASGLGNVTPQVAQARRAYALLGAEERLVHVVFKGGHRWHGERAIPWLRERL